MRLEKKTAGRTWIIPESTSQTGTRVSPVTTKVMKIVFLYTLSMGGTTSTARRSFLLSAENEAKSVVL